MSMKTLLFDTETTGLRLPSIASQSRQPYIIEYYGCIVDETTWQIISEIDELISVPVPVTAEITKITGITPADLAGKPSFDALAPAIKQQIESVDRVVAHNATFDRDMVNGEMDRHGFTVQWPEIVCTVERTEHLFGHRLTMTALHEHLFGEGFKGAHRAKDDVAALLRCYRELVARGEI